MTTKAAQGDPDRQLVAAARGGDFSAFERLVGRYERPLYRLAARIVRNEHDAEEVVQESFLAALEHLAEFHGRSTFHAWLVRIATNNALKVLRKRRGLPLVATGGGDGDDDHAPLPHPEFVAPWRDDPAVIAENRETRRWVEAALVQLDEKYRLVFLLRDVEGLSTDEAAEVLGITPNNAKVRLLRARLMLREKLTRALGDEQKRITVPHDHE